MARKFLLFLFFIASYLTSFAQDVYSGTWQMKQEPAFPTISAVLQISSSEKNILYPALLKISCDHFNAEYEFLLVKKSGRELAISRNKKAVFERPFSSGNLLWLLNGIFDHSKDQKRNPTLTLMRISANPAIGPLPDTGNLEIKDKDALNHLMEFLKRGEISFTKLNEIPWQSESVEKIIKPELSHGYFGVTDTVQVKQRDGIIELSGQKKNGSDLVSVTLNGRNLQYLVQASRKKISEEIMLDTGMNILAFFADNFGNDLPNKGRMVFEFAGKKKALDFSDKLDSAAGFIVAKVYVVKDSSNTPTFENNNQFDPSDSLKPGERLTGNIVAHSSQITLAVWDDAVEDGDSISLNIDGIWIAQGLPVKKYPQFITVTLKPGKNVITFLGDNLGSIPPNTSVLEIIDGKRRKTFHMETNPGEKNLVKVLYNSQ